MGAHEMAQSVKLLPNKHEYPSSDLRLRLQQTKPGAVSHDCNSASGAEADTTAKHSGELY